MRTIIIAHEILEGKTTHTAINLGAALARKGKKVLIIDLDPEGHATFGLNMRTEDTLTLAELLIEERIQAFDVIRATGCQNLDIIPSDLSLLGANLRLSMMGGKDFRLRSKIQDITRCYDFILIDCPLAFSTLTINAYTAGREILLPIHLEAFSSEKIKNFIKSVEFVNRDINSVISHQIEISGVLLSTKEKETKSCRAALHAVQEIFGKKIFKTRIRAEKTKGQKTFLYADQSQGAEIYSSVADEFLTKSFSS